MRHQHDGLRQRLLDRKELVLQPSSHHGVDSTERLVHQQHVRDRRRAPRGDSDALPLTAGQLVRVPVCVLAGLEAHRGQQLVDALVRASLVPAEQLRQRRDVRANGLVREQADLLDDVADLAAQLDGICPGDILAVELDASSRWLDEPVDHLQRRGLAAPGRSYQRDQLSARHIQVELLHGDGAPGVGLADTLQPDHQIFATVHAVTLLASAAPDASCYSSAVNNWVCPSYFRDKADDLISATTEHVTITVAAVLLGLVLAVPLAVVARRYSRLEGLIMGVSTGIYTIPSLALFPLLTPFTGISATTVIIGLALYTLTILVRNALAGLSGVPDEVRSPLWEAATGRLACCCRSSCRWRCRW